MYLVECTDMRMATKIKELMSRKFPRAWRMLCMVYVLLSLHQVCMYVRNQSGIVHMGSCFAATFSIVSYYFSNHVRFHLTLKDVVLWFMLMTFKYCRVYSFQHNMYMESSKSWKKEGTIQTVGCKKMFPKWL